MHIVGEESGETLSALRCLSYLINNFLTNIKQLAETSTGSFSIPLLVSVRALSVPCHILIKLCYTEALEWLSLVPGPKAKSSSEIMNLTLFIVSYPLWFSKHYSSTPPPHTHHLSGFHFFFFSRVSLKARITMKESIFQFFQLVNCLFSEKAYVKAVYCHATYLTYMQSTSWEMLGWRKHKLESRLPGKYQ